MTPHTTHRMGPNGRRTLCNRCGLRWAREQKEAEKEEERKRKRKVADIVAIAEPPVPAAAMRRRASNAEREKKL